jgi:hypothetical protein
MVSAYVESTGYLISSFLSPTSNKRTDEYGTLQFATFTNAAFLTSYLIQQ